MIKNFFKIIIIFIISIIIGNMAYGIYREYSIGDNPNGNNSDYINYNIIENSTSETNKIEKIPNEYKGYSVIAKIDIPKINLVTYVFGEYSEDAMWICPSKYYGPNPNEIGNLCIAAHNYDKPNMFNHIIELNEGDLIFLSDNKNGEKKYVVYDIYKSDPKDTIALSQDTNGNTDITLITCSDYSSKRIIVKARKQI